MALFEYASLHIGVHEIIEFVGCELNTSCSGNPYELNKFLKTAIIFSLVLDIG
jgi:hypothetical protein